MARETIKIQREAYRRDQVSVALDTSFTSYLPPTVEVDNDTVENLFRLYNTLFYSIPVQGETNSHEYLIKNSSSLVNFDQTTTELQPLLDEIAQLRQQLLNANQEILDLQNR